MHEDDEGKPISDSDRAAILARRKQFIALALSGLATTIACTDGGEETRDDKSTQPSERHPSPQVCLSIEPIEPESGPKPEPVEPEPVPPQVCLKIAVPKPEPEPNPEPSGETGEAQAEPKPEPKPQPCLRKPVPKPCLNVQRPSND